MHSQEWQDLYQLPSQNRTSPDFPSGSLMLVEQFLIGLRTGSQGRTATNDEC